MKQWQRTGSPRLSRSDQFLKVGLSTGASILPFSTPWTKTDVANGSNTKSKQKGLHVQHAPHITPRSFLPVHSSYPPFPFTLHCSHITSPAYGQTRNDRNTQMRHKKMMESA